MTAKSVVVCYTLARKSFDSLLGPIQDVWRFEALRKVPILFSLSNSQLFDLAHCMKYHTLQAGQIVFKKGEPGELLLVLLMHTQAMKLLIKSEKPPPDHGPLYLPACLLTCPSIWLPVPVAGFVPACLPACLSVCLSVCLSICLSVCPSVCLVFETSESHAGDVFYVVEEGNFTIYDDDENELARVGKGSCFGELALLRQVSLWDTKSNTVFTKMSISWCRSQQDNVQGRLKWFSVSVKIS